MSNAIDGIAVLVVGIATLPIAAVMARCALQALLAGLLQSASDPLPLASVHEISQQKAAA